MKYLRDTVGLRAAGTMRVGAALIIVSAALAAHGQAPTGIGTRWGGYLAPAGVSPTQAPASGEIVRTIDDPHTGAHWLLMRDAGHPGGPGRLVIVEGTRNRTAQNQAEIEPSHTEFRPVLRAGDRLIVEENTLRVEARFEAVALGPAAPGSVLAVRLKLGGRVVRAVALGPGRALLQPGTEERP
jgi:hypothetical protein